MRDGYRCQAHDSVPSVACQGVLEAHETAQRSLVPGSHLRLDLMITLCTAHHSWIDNNILRAHELGLLRHSWDVPNLHWADCDDVEETEDEYGNPCCKSCGVRLPAERRSA